MFADCRVGRIGGGTLILAKSSLRPSSIKLSSNPTHGCNITAINIGMANLKTIVCCAYRPPDTRAAETDLFIKELASINELAKVRIFAGDFNLPHINWFRSSFTARDNVSNAFQHACDEMGLSQCVNSNTHGSNLLDLVLLSHPDSLMSCTCRPPIATSDHLSVHFSLAINMLKVPQLQTQSVNFDKADMQRAAILLAAVNWRDAFACCVDADDYVAKFMSVLTSILIQCLPSSQLRQNKPKRIVPKHISALTLKKRRLWHKIHDVSSLQEYIAACDAVKGAINQHISKQELDLVSHPNLSRYNYVNRALGQQRCSHQLVDTSGNAFTDDAVAANMFNQEFVSNFSPAQMSQTSYCSNSELAFNITQLDTYKVLASSSNSAAGPDGISDTVLRKLAHVLALPLSIVFQQSVSHNTFPSAWKKAVVVPIYKGKGSKSSASSYRPISLCSTIGKALELIICDQIMAVVQNTKPQCTVQHGFTHGRSTISNLLCAENELANAHNSKESYEIITFDFSRAFDRVPHHLLLNELAAHGITGSALQWVQSFLSGRSQAVRIGSSLSAAAAVTSGVIQGSCLGPTLFNIFLDRLLNDLDILAGAYADDLKFTANLVHHSYIKIQSNINRVNDWSVAMDMPLSIEKCLVLHCGLNNPQYQYQCGGGVLPATDSLAPLMAPTPSTYQLYCRTKRKGCIFIKSLKLSFFCFLHNLVQLFIPHPMV